MSVDLLGFDAPVGTASAPADALVFDFDPDSVVPAASSSHFDFNPDSVAPAAPASNTSSLNGPASASIDPEELRRRIRGEGSEQPSKLQRASAVAADAAKGASERIRGVACGATAGLRLRLAETPRWKLMVALLMLLLVIGGISLYVRKNRDPSDEVIVTQASKVPVKGQSKPTSGLGSHRASEDQLDESEDQLDEDTSKRAKKKAKVEDSDEDIEKSVESVSTVERAAPSSGSWAKDLASLRQVITESSESMRTEIASLRGEVVKMRREIGQLRQGAKSDVEPEPERQSRSFASASQSKASGVGEIHSESRRGGSAGQIRGSRQARPAATSESRPTSARSRVTSPKEEDDDSIGSIGEIVTR
jgi:hypothetical protein